MTKVLSLSWQRVAFLAAALAVGAACAISFNASPVSAACIDTDNDPTTPCVSDAGGTLGANDLLPTSFTSETGLGNANLETTIGALIKTVIRFLGIIAVIVVLYGGFRWMTASGNDEKVAEAKRILIAGMIGLAIVLTALAITNFIIGQILGATADSLPVQ